MSPVRLIARDELRLMARNRVAVIAFVLLVLLTLAAVMSAWSHQRSTSCNQPMAGATVTSNG